MKDLGGEALGKVVTILAILALIPIGIILNGWIISDMWEWFLVPIFPSLPLLSTGQAVGLGVITGHMCKYVKLYSEKETAENGVWNPIIQAMLYPLGVWFSAWLIYLYIS